MRQDSLSPLIEGENSVINKCLLIIAICCHKLPDSKILVEF